MNSNCNKCLHQSKNECELGDMCRYYPKYKCDLVAMVYAQRPDFSISKLWGMNNGELDALAKGEQFGRKPIYLTKDEIDDLLAILPTNDVLIAKLRRAKYGIDKNY